MKPIHWVIILLVGILWMLPRYQMLQVRQSQPVALCPNFDTMLVSHKLSSSGWGDSTLHTHSYKVNLDTIAGCIVK